MRMLPKYDMTQPLDDMPASLQLLAPLSAVQRNLGRTQLTSTVVDHCEDRGFIKGSRFAFWLTRHVPNAGPGGVSSKPFASCKPLSTPRVIEAR